MFVADHLLDTLRKVLARHERCQKVIPGGPSAVLRSAVHAVLDNAERLGARECKCAEIIGTDATRHFKECPRRADYPTASTLPCSACNGSGREEKQT